MKLKAVFLDKDGSVMPEAPQNDGINNFTLSDDVVEGLQMLQSYGYLLVMVSNQPAMNRQQYSEEQLNNEIEVLYESCSKVGIYLDGFYDCTKLLPELLMQAAGDKDIDLSSSWMVGDILHDVEAGNKAGCKAILINNGNEKEWKPGQDRMPEYFAKDLSEAAKYIVAVTKMKNMAAQRNEQYIMNHA